MINDLMKQFKLIIFLPLLIFTANAQYQQSNKKSLFVASCETEAQKCQQQSLSRFDFENGKLLSSEKLLTFETNKARFDFGKTRILLNRYIVSQWGDIFDTQTKELFAQERGNFVAFENNQIIILQVIINKDDKVFTFDLNTKEYKEMKSPNIFLAVGFGTFSPSNSRGAIYISNWKNIQVFQRGKKQTDISQNIIGGSFDVGCGKDCKDFRRIVPMLWLDENRILTQKKNGELLVIDFIKKKNMPLASIPVPEALESIPSIYADEAGNIYYRADKIYLIDVVNRKYTETNAYGLGNNFQRLGISDEKVFTSKDKEIGKFRSGNSLTIENYLAAEYSPDNVSINTPRLLKVWSEELQKWTTIYVKYFPSVLGWIEN